MVEENQEPQAPVGETGPAEPTLPTEEKVDPQAGGPSSQEKSAVSRKPQIKIDETQKNQRRENLDFLRILGQYAGSAIPWNYNNYIHVANDMVIGSKGPSDTEVSSTAAIDRTEISKREIDKVRDVFQPPLNYHIALPILKKERLVVLTGRAYSGKRTSAIMMALDLDTSNSIREISPDQDIPKQVEHLLYSQANVDGTVMIADGILRDTARSLPSHAMRNLQNLLERKNAYLILCVQSDVNIASDVRRVTIDPPPVPTEVLIQAHLDYYLGDGDKDETMKVFDEHERIQKIIKEEQLYPRQVDHFVERVVMAVRYHTNLEDALQYIGTDFLEDEVIQWIAETADNPDECSFRISLAVFSGWTMKEIVKASKALKVLLFPVPEDHPDKQTEKKTGGAEIYISPLKKPTSDLIERARARRIKRSYLTEYSDHAVLEVIELENVGYSKALLKYLWEEVFEWQEPLLIWLLQHATKGVDEMRFRAAGAVGALASVDFHSIRSRVFVPWGNSDLDDPVERRRQYQALTNSIGVLIWNEEQAENVLGLLNYWVEKGNIAMKWAAARAYSSVGLVYPREAIQQWRRILENEKEFNIVLTYGFGLSVYAPIHQDFLQSLLDAILSLFSRAVEMPHKLTSVYEQAVVALADWVALDEKDGQENNSGLVLFVIISDIRYPPDDGAGELEDWPPAMLQVASSQLNENYDLTLASLLRKALNHSDPEFSEVAAEALKRWVDCSEERTWLYDTLLSILKKMLSLPNIRQREYGRLWRHLNSWANSPQKKSDAAEKLLIDLNLSR
jgi:hypothetical protein